MTLVLNKNHIKDFQQIAKAEKKAIYLNKLDKKLY